MSFWPTRQLLCEAERTWSTTRETPPAGREHLWSQAGATGAEAFYAACGFERGAENEQGLHMLLNTTSAGDVPNPTAA